MLQGDSGFHEIKGGNRPTVVKQKSQEKREKFSGYVADADHPVLNGIDL